MGCGRLARHTGTDVDGDPARPADPLDLPVLQVPAVFGQPIPQSHDLAMDENVGQGDGERLLEVAEQPRVVGIVAVGALGGQHNCTDPSAVGRQPHPQYRPAPDADHHELWWPFSASTKNAWARRTASSRPRHERLEPI